LIFQNFVVDSVISLPVEFCESSALSYFMTSTLNDQNADCDTAY